MTPEEMRATLADLGWSQADLARRLSEESDEPVAATTIWRYVSGRIKIPAGLAAYLRLAVRANRGGIEL